MASVTYLTGQTKSGAVASYSYNLTYTSAAYDRAILMQEFIVTSTSVTTTMSSVSFGGNNGPILVQPLGSSNAQHYVAYGLLPAGSTSMTVTTTRSDASAVRGGANFYILDDIDTVNIDHSDYQGTASFLAGSISTPSAGFVVGFATHRTSSDSGSFANLSTDSTLSTTSISSNASSLAVSGSSLSDTITFTGSSASAMSLIFLPANNNDSVTTSYTTQYSPSVSGLAGYSVPTGSGVSFATVRGGNGNTTDTAFTNAYIGSDSTGRTNLFTTMFRAITIFDTTSLPTNATITGARIIITGTAKQSNLGTTDLYVVGVNSGGVFNIINSDYQNVQGTSFGSVTYAGFNAAGTNTITLNSNGLAAIVPGQYSKYAYRTGFDMLNSAPSWSASQASSFSMNGATAKLEVDYDITVTTKNQTGKAKIIGTYQKNQTGTATIAGQYELAGWGFSVPGITYWGDSPIAQQSVASTQDQLGKARITASTSQTQTGISRIQTTTSNTQTGISRITVSTQRTQSGVARVTAATTQVQTGRARIEISTSQSQNGISRITQSVTRDQTGIARLLSSAVATAQTINGVARITDTATRNQTGVASILNAVARTQNGLARIAIVTSQAQTGRSRINVTLQMTQQGLARVETTVTSTQLGKAAIVNSLSRIQTGIARITAATQKNQTGKASILVEVNRTITGKARIGLISAKTITGVANIDNPTIGNGAYIPQFPGEGSLDEADNPDGGAYIPQFDGAGSLEEAGAPDEGSYIPQFPSEGELK